MSQRIHNILLLILALLPGWLTVAPAMAQNRTVVFAGEVTELSVVEVQDDTYVWDLYNDPTVNFANTDGNIDPSEAEFVEGINTGATVNVRWLEPGLYFFRVMAFDPTGCTNNLKVGIVEVLKPLPTAHFLEPDTVCVDDPAIMTLELTGDAPWSVTYSYTIQGSGDIHTATINDINDSPFEFTVVHSTPGTYEYWVVSVTDTDGLTNDEETDPVLLQVEPRPVTSPIYRYDPLTQGDE